METKYSNRPNKRKSLNDVFRKINNFIEGNFVYVTLGSQEIKDVYDLLEIFQKQQIIFATKQTVLLIFLMDTVINGKIFIHLRDGHLKNLLGIQEVWEKY